MVREVIKCSSTIASIPMMCKYSFGIKFGSERRVFTSGIGLHYALYVLFSEIKRFKLKQFN